MDVQHYHNGTTGLLGERTLQEQNRANNTAFGGATKSSLAAQKLQSTAATVTRQQQQLRLLRKQQNFDAQRQHVPEVTQEQLVAAPELTSDAEPALAPNPYLLTPLDVLAKRDNKQVSLTVVFDLDETLVYNRRMDIDYALLRPYALHMLNALRHMPGVEIVMWTASTQETAAPVIDQLNSRGLVFDELIFRDRRWFTDLVHTKDLRLLGRDMSRVVIIDNQPNCVKLNPQNAILISDYVGTPCDPSDLVNADASLVNLYYIVEVLLQQCIRGIGVPETLFQLANERDEGSSLCRQVELKMPGDWELLSLEELAEYDPLRVPPRGYFVRVNFNTPACLEHWTMQ